MAIERYRDVAEMPPPPRPSRENLTRVIVAVWERAHLALPPDFPRGVMKFRTLEAAQAQRQQVTYSRIRQLRAGRLGETGGSSPPASGR